ncbi:MAG: DUF2848 family protein [Halolamina sp.]|uniref:DUF2848 family protein n=1 Tax=Halolamina sp. TaxID=1940283 RepID=UPI002FC32C32
MRLEIDVAGELVQVAVSRVVNAGYSGRDESAVQEHIDELVADGIAAPEQVPATYAVAPNSLRAEPDAIQVVGNDTAGEAEFGLVLAGGETYVVAASDQTDRALERESVQKAKQITPNVLSREAWRLSDVQQHWDEIELRAWTTVDGERRRYQEDPLAALLAPGDILDVVHGRYGTADGGEVVLSGTVATIEGEVQPGSRFEVELVDPVRERSLSVAYDVETL